MTPSRFRAFIVSGLRKQTYKWPARSEAKKKAKVAYGKYKCAGCEEIYRAKDVQVDHIEPVVDPARGFTTWDEYIARMFCPAEGFQVLCKPCHAEKTKEEQANRKKKRRTNKKTKKRKR